MRVFAHRHKRKIVTGAPIIFLLLLGSSGALMNGNTLSFSNLETPFVTVGDEIHVSLDLTTRTPVNATGGTVTFPSDIVAMSSLSRTSSIIDLWSEEPVVSNDDGTVRFSGGIIGPHVGENGNRGQVFVLNMRAMKEGKATLRVKDGELLANDGSGDNTLTGTGSITLYVRERGRQSPDVNADGTLSIADVNALYLKTFRAFDERYDLSGDGKVDWADVRLLIGLL